MTCVCIRYIPRALIGYYLSIIPPHPFVIPKNKQKAIYSNKLSINLPPSASNLGFDVLTSLSLGQYGQVSVRYFPPHSRFINYILPFIFSCFSLNKVKSQYLSHLLLFPRHSFHKDAVERGLTKHRCNVSPEKSGNQIFNGKSDICQGGEFPVGVAEDLDTRQPQNVEARFLTKLTTLSRKYLR